MRISILPKTTPGKWSVGLAVLFIVIFVLHQIFAASVRHNPVAGVPPPPPSPLINFMVVIDYASGIISFLAALFSIIWKKERSIIVFILGGAWVVFLLFLLGEILIPH